MLINFLLAFIPIFVAVDPIGVLPIYVSLTKGLSARGRRTIITHSVATAMSVAVGFLVLGKMIFRFLGITIADFMISGGAILFSIGLMDLLRPGKYRRVPSEQLGVVPLGTPLIVGPAVLTTSLMVLDQQGMVMTLASILLNILFVGFVFWRAEGLLKILGQAGANALSKIMALLLAAIAVMMIRKGVLAIVVQFTQTGPF